MSFDYPALAAELASDLEGLGYAAATDQEAADLLNSLTTSRLRERDIVPAHEVFEAIVPADMPTAEALTKFTGLLSMGEVNAKGANTRALLANLFTGKSTTLANLVALQTEIISRATELGFRSVTASDVTRARAG